MFPRTFRGNAIRDGRRVFGSIACSGDCGVRETAVSALRSAWDFISRTRYSDYYVSRRCVRLRFFAMTVTKNRRDRRTPVRVKMTCPSCAVGCGEMINSRVTRNNNTVSFDTTAYNNNNSNSSGITTRIIILLSSLYLRTRASRPA